MLEKGFVLGASEDGTVYYRKNKNEYGLEIEQKVKKWLEAVQAALKKAYNKESKIRKMKKGYYRLNVYSKDLYFELLDFRNNPKKILQQTRNFQIGFLRGVFDAEGSVRLDRNHITVSSNRKGLIDVISKILSKNGIKVGKKWQDKTSVITLPFYGKENMGKFYSVVNFRHPEKKRRLELLLKDNGV